MPYSRRRNRNNTCWQEAKLYKSPQPKKKSNCLQVLYNDDSDEHVTNITTLENTEHSYQIIQDLGVKLLQNLLKQESSVLILKLQDLTHCMELVVFHFIRKREKAIMFQENKEDAQVLIDKFIPFLRKWVNWKIVKT
jgi:hypothetical protein